jgi:hypothetical protein
MLSAANQFATRWFPRAQIAIANALCVFALFASDALGTFLSAWFIREDATEESIFNFFLWESAALIAVHLLNAIFFRGEPSSPQKYISGNLATRRWQLEIPTERICVLCLEM